MANQVTCECGYIIRDDDEDRLVAQFGTPSVPITPRSGHGDPGDDPELD
jgi:hypothetical protein